MKNNTGRRTFLKKISAGTTAALLPAGIVLSAKKDNLHESQAAHSAVKNPIRAYNTAYTGAHLNRVAFPMGGLGAGMICMEGTGAISHVSVRNRPEIFNEPGLFAAIAVKGIQQGAKLLEGPAPDWKKFGLRDAGNGLTGSTTGLPRFRQASFKGRFPFGQLDISDADLPLRVQVTGWSPFIPSDDDNSALPVAAMEYSFTNTGKTTAEAVFSFNTKNFLSIDKGNNSIRSYPNGFILTETGSAAAPYRSDFAVYTDDAATQVDHCWFRGGWWDPLTMAWNTVKNAAIKSVSPVEKDAPGASLYVPFTLAAGAKKTIRVMMAWYTPESEQTHGTMGARKEHCKPEEGCCNSPADISLDKYDKDFNGKFYKPWYSSRFASAEAVADYWKQQYTVLKKNTQLFTDAFYSSSSAPVRRQALEF
jgi:uncharacterized protein (DUF608 family)